MTTDNTRTSRRARREEARQGVRTAVEKQIADEPALIAAGRNAPPAPRADPLTTPVEKAVAKSRAKKAHQKGVKAQVSREAQRTSNPELLPEDEFALTPGKQPPLHTLNRMARQSNIAIRDEAIDHGSAVGKFAKDQIIGRADRGRHSKLAKVRRVQSQAEGRRKAAEARAAAAKAQ